LLLAKGRVTEPPALAKVSDDGVHPATGDQVELREGFGRQPVSQGAGSGVRFDVSVFEVQRPVPLSRGDGREGQGGARCRREGARARRSVLQRPAGRGSGLAAGARERSRGAR